MPRARKDKRHDRSWIDALTPEEQTRLMREEMEKPSYTGLPDAIDYPDRTDDEFVVSGPLGDFPGSGRRFPDIPTALSWAQGKYARARLIHTREDAPRWAILVKPKAR